MGWVSSISHLPPQIKYLIAHVFSLPIFMLLNIQNSRKRRHSTRPIDEEIQEAKLQLLLLQVKREEVLLQQDKAKVLQEAKTRQEVARAALLERELEISKSSVT